MNEDNGNGGMAMMMKRVETFADPERAERAIARGVEMRGLERRLVDKMKVLSVPQGEDEGRWYVIRARRRTEETVAKAVEDFGLETWVPMEKALPKRLRHGGNRAIERPVFEGFVFVRLIANNYAWLVLAGLKNVSGMIGTENGPLPVPTQNMKALKAMEGAGVFAKAKNSRRLAKALIAQDYPLGSRVEIQDGPFRLFEAVVEGYVHTRHVRAMFHLFGRQTVVELEIDQLKRLG